MPAEVTLHPPEILAPYWSYIIEGWDAFFANKEPSDNPYPEFDVRRAAWRWGYFEGMDYGN